LDRAFRERRDLTHGLVDGREAEQVSPADADELALAVAAQDGLQRRAVQRARGARRFERRGGPRPLARADLEDLPEAFGPRGALSGERRRQDGAAADDAEERRD